MLQEDNISTALRGRSSFSWSCSLRRLQEVSLFFSEREGSVSEGRNEHQPCHLKCVLEEIPLVLDLRLQSCLISRTGAVWMESLQGHPPKCLQEWCCSSLFPWSESRTRTWAGNVRDTLLLEVLPLFSHLRPELLFISGAETCVWQFKEKQDCQIGPKPLTCSRSVRLAQSPWCAPNCSEPTHWDSITHHSEHPELKLSLLERSKVWSREGNPAATKKT